MIPSPFELVERCVPALSDEGDWVLDPFAGVGSALPAAIRHNRRAAGGDKEADYIALARERIEALFNGTPGCRKLGTPVCQPCGRDKVSRIPDEWQQANSFLTP